MFTLPLVAALGAALLSQAGSPPARRVAVLDFGASWASDCGSGRADPAQREQCELLRMLADEARGGALEALAPPAYVVLTRENTAQILKDMGGTCAEGECEVETARLIGASVVVSGQVSLMEGTWIASLKAHDVATAALLATRNVQGRSKLELFANVRAETARMLRGAAALGLASSPATPPTFVAPVEPALPAWTSEPPERAEVTSPPRGSSRGRGGAAYVEARGGSGLAWGPIDGMSAKPLGDVLLEGRLGLRLTQEWSAEIGGGYLNFYKDKVDVNADLFVETKAFTLGLGAVRRVHPNLSLAGQLGLDRATHRATLTFMGTTTDETNSEWLLHVGVEARADATVGPVDLGVRLGLRAERSPQLDGMLVVVPATVAVTYRF